LFANHGDKPALVEPLIAVAREELEHYQQVYRWLQKRGVGVAPDEPDPYVNALLASVRHPPGVHLLDRLVVAALIEARSCERLGLVAAAAREPELRAFYASLSRSEAGHFRVFLRIAERLYREGEVTDALARWLALEAAVVARLPLRAAVH
jgi:tRNA-(ms[2]io[6]A)-hydroxylase